MNKNILIETWKQYHENTGLEFGKKSDAFKWFDSEMLYTLIRILKPKKIIEMSPDKGWTSEILIKASEDNNQKVNIYSFDIHNDSKELDRNGKVSRKLIVGKAQETLTADFLDCDFMFIDSDHTYNFGLWYASEILPNLRKGTYIWIHDWPTYEACGWNGHILDEKSAGQKWGEPLAVKTRFLGENIETKHSEDKNSVSIWDKRDITFPKLGEPVLNTTELFKDVYPYKDSEIVQIINNNGCLSQILRKTM